MIRSGRTPERGDERRPADRAFRVSQQFRERVMPGESRIASLVRLIMIILTAGGADWNADQT